MYVCETDEVGITEVVGQVAMLLHTEQLNILN